MDLLSLCRTEEIIALKSVVNRLLCLQRFQHGGNKPNVSAAVSIFRGTLNPAAIRIACNGSPDMEDSSFPIDILRF